MFEAYDNYISKEFSVDYWSDVGIDQAITMLMEFDENDWALLNSACLARENFWLVKCAECLGDHADKNSFNALLSIAELGDENAKEAALDSINSISSLGFDISPYSNSIKNILSTTKRRPHNILENIILALEKKLDNNV